MMNAKRIHVVSLVIPSLILTTVGHVLPQAVFLLAVFLPLGATLKIILTMMSLGAGVGLTFFVEGRSLLWALGAAL